MKVVGIDIGTTSISAAVYQTSSGQVCMTKTIANDAFLKTEYEWERIQDPERIITCAAALLEEMIRKHPDISAIGLTGQMHGILYTDEEGHSVSPLYTWQDKRGSLQRHDGQSMVQQIYEKTGLTVPTGYGLVTHLALYDHPERAVSMCTIADYFGMRLTGRKTPLVHISNAASFGFYDVGKNCFREKDLKRMGMDLSLLPEVTDEFALLGSWQGIPVRAAIGDNQASFLGSVGFDKFTALVNMGTGGQISVLSDEAVYVDGIETRPMTRGKYLLVGASLCGGRAYAILERFFRTYECAAHGEDTPQYDVMEKLARKAWEEDRKNAFRLRVDTAFMGTREDPDRLGSIEFLSEDTFTPESMILGVMEGMARELYDMYGRIEAVTRIRANRLIASGNGFRRNQTLQEVFQAVFQMDLKLAECTEEAACGAAISAAGSPDAEETGH